MEDAFCLYSRLHHIAQVFKRANIDSSNKLTLVTDTAYDDQRASPAFVSPNGCLSGLYSACFCLSKDKRFG